MQKPCESSKPAVSFQTSRDLKDFCFWPGACRRGCPPGSGKIHRQHHKNMPSAVCFRILPDTWLALEPGGLWAISESAAKTLAIRVTPVRSPAAIASSESTGLFQLAFIFKELLNRFNIFGRSFILGKLRPHLFDGDLPEFGCFFFG
jgi:hypothetical protein